MAFTPLHDFTASFTGGFQKSNRFRVLIDLTNLFIDFKTIGYSTALDWLKEGLLCRTVTTPTREFATNELKIYGYSESYPVLTSFTTLTCTFLLPLDVRLNNIIFDVFQQWQNGIQDVRDTGNRTFRFPDEYRLAKGFTVETYTGYSDPSHSEEYQNSLGERTSKIEYYNVYPKTISAATLDWNTTNEFLELPIEFSYTHWERFD